MRAIIIGGGYVARDIEILCVTKGIETTRLEPDPHSWPRLDDAEWIVEASGLTLDARRRLLASIALARGPDSVITADESVIPRAELLAGMDPAFRRHFAIAHVFVPMRKLRLVELVTGGEMVDGASSLLERLLRERLDRHVVRCPDMPGFIANRIGLFLVAKGIQLAGEARLPPADVDAAATTLLGLPRTGIFGLADLIGHDVLIGIAAQLKARLPGHDAWQGCDLQDLASDDKAEPPAYGSGAEPVARRLAGEVGAYARQVADAAGMPMAEIEDIMRAGFGWSAGIPGLGAGCENMRSPRAGDRSREFF